MARKAKPPVERKLEMVEAARRLFYSRGFAKTTISEIIEDVEVSKGLFYYYFGSKEEILDEIVNQMVAEDVAALEVIAARADLQPGEAIVMMLAMHRSLVAAGGDIAVQLRGINNPEIVIKTVRQVATRLSPIFAEVVQRGAAASQFRVEDPRECIRILLSAFTFDAVFGAGAQRVDHDAAFLQILERSLGAAPGSLPGFRT
jgi:AcrR family transcriptional regulator